MNDQELDQIYTDLCLAMTALGPQNASLLLARFALLAFDAIGDAATVRRLLEEAKNYE